MRAGPTSSGDRHAAAVAAPGQADRWPRPGGLYRPAPLEVAAGWVFGVDDGAGPLAGTQPPRAVLEQLVLEALQRPPCVVSFSGGRDSSAVLAVATSVARRHGLPLPLPVTRVYPGHSEADETAWQTAVIRHLALDDWVRLPVRDECDLIGPLATPLLRRFGVVWPFAAYTNAPVFAVARGGTVLTGEGGDNVFGPHRGAVLRHLLVGRHRQRLRALRAAPANLGPRSLRARRLRATVRHRVQLPWLRPQAAAATWERMASDEARAPLDWGRAVAWESRRRSWRAGRATIQAIADDLDVAVGHLLLDPRFLCALANAPGHRFGPMSRTEGMAQLFGDLLPSAVLTRATKAVFNTTVVGGASRRFVATWTGDGLDAALVDQDELRRAWSSRQPPAASFGLLQTAWLATDGRRCEGRAQDDRRVPRPEGRALTETRQGGDHVS